MSSTTSRRCWRESNGIPRQSRGRCEPLKAACRDVAATRPLEPPSGWLLWLQPELFYATIFSFRVLDVRSNRLFISTHRGHEVAAGPEVLPDEIPRPARRVPDDADALFPLIQRILIPFPELSNSGCRPAKLGGLPRLR